MARELFDVQYRALTPVEPLQGPRFGQITQTVKDGLVAYLRQMMYAPDLPAGRLEEIATLRKYLRRTSDPTSTSTAVDLSTRAFIARKHPGLFERLPHVIVSTSSGEIAPIAIGTPYVATVQEPPRVDTPVSSPEPYALEDGAVLALRVRERRSGAPGGAGGQLTRIVFAADRFVDITAATAQEIVDEVNALGVIARAERINLGTAAVPVWGVRLLPVGRGPVIIEVDSTSSDAVIDAMGIGQRGAVTSWTVAAGVATLVTTGSPFATTAIGLRAVISGMNRADRNDGAFEILTRPDANTLTLRVPYGVTESPVTADAEWFIGQRDSFANTVRPPLHRYGRTARVNVRIDINASDENVRTELTDLVEVCLSFLAERDIFTLLGRSLLPDPPDVASLLATPQPSLEKYQVWLAGDVRRAGETETPRPGDTNDKVYSDGLDLTLFVTEFLDREVYVPNVTPVQNFITSTSDISYVDTLQLPDVSPFDDNAGDETLPAEDPPEPLIPLTARLMLSLSGQSNSSPASGGAPALSTTQPYDNLRRSGVTAIPLVETTNESLASGCANWLTFNEAGRGTIFDGWGVSSTAYSGLARGTIPYTTGITGVTQARTGVATARPTESFSYGALLWVHGETDDVANVTAATYHGFMETLQANWEADVQAALGVTMDRIPLFMTQHACHSRLVRAHGAPVSAGQEDAARNHPGSIIVSHPTYHITYNANDIHYSNVGQLRNGEYFARAVYQTLIVGEDWVPLRPRTITANNATVVLTFEGGDGSALVFDTTNMRAKPFMGFEYTDDQADTPAIVNVAITNTRQVTITLSRNASAAGRVRYAYSCIGNTDAGPTSLGGLGGNLRDQDPTLSRAGGNPLWNWCVTFDRPIDSFTGVASPTAAFSNTQSVDFSGAGFLSARNIANFDGLGAATWSWWQRTNGAWPATDQVIIGRNAANQRHHDFRLRTGSSMRFTIPSTLASAADYVDVGGWTPAVWQHVTAVFNAGTFTVYRNAVAVAGTVNGTIPATLTSGSVQGTEIGGVAGSVLASVNLAHMMIWTGQALTAPQVAELYNSAIPRDPRALSFAAPSNYWPLQGTYEDLGTATTRNLLPYGTVTFEASAP